MRALLTDGRTELSEPIVSITGIKLCHLSFIDMCAARFAICFTCKVQQSLAFCLN